MIVNRYMDMADKNAEYFMRLALKEAKKGLGRTSPNPCVGAVIVKNNTVIATGYHKKAGTPHAEIHALQVAGENAVGAAMYVTLEPCNHYGRTGPCSHAVADSGIRKVIVGLRDPNPLVDGSGVDYLRGRGIEVSCGVLEKACRDINKPFLKYIVSSRPWVTIKAGLSLDGRLSYRHGEGGKITGPDSFRKVHRLRDAFDAILVGIGTVKADNPSLTTRIQRGKGKDPVRIILDSKLQIDETARVLEVEKGGLAWIFCLETEDSDKIKRLTRRGVTVFPVAPDKNNRIDLDVVLKVIADQGMSSVMVEGGATVHGSFLREGLVDYAYLFYAPIFAGDCGVPLVTGLEVHGGKKSAIKLVDVSTRRYGNDWMVSGDVVYPD